MGVDAETGVVVVNDAAVAVRAYFWALTLSAVVTAVLIGGTAWVMGIPLAFTIAVVTLVTSYVPYVGAIVSGAFACLIALGSNGIEAAIVMLVVILVVQNIVQTIVLVKLAGAALSLHPIVVLGATIIGAAVAGMLGAALASPAVAVALTVRRRLASAAAGEAPVVRRGCRRTRTARSDVAGGRAHGLRPVAAAEQHGVQQQRVHLVQQHPVAPAVGQRLRLGVGGEHPLQLRCPEQGQHRQVRLAVATVRRGVDQHRRVGGPQHVARPQVTVQAGGWLPGVEGAVGDPGRQPLEHRDPVGVEGPSGERLAEQRRDARLRVERSPRRPLAQREGQWLGERSEPAVTDPARWAAAVCRRTGRVGGGEPVPQPLGRRGVGAPGVSSARSRWDGPSSSTSTTAAPPVGRASASQRRPLASHAK